MTRRIAPIACTFALLAFPSGCTVSETPTVVSETRNLLEDLEDDGEVDSATREAATAETRETYASDDFVDRMNRAQRHLATLKRNWEATEAHHDDQPAEDTGLRALFDRLSGAERRLRALEAEPSPHRRAVLTQLEVDLERLDDEMRHFRESHGIELDEPTPVPALPMGG